MLFTSPPYTIIFYKDNNIFLPQLKVLHNYPHDVIYGKCSTILWG